MSADNLLAVVAFTPKDTGVVEFRVLEVRLSGMWGEIFNAFSVGTHARLFKTYPSMREAVAYARRWENSLNIVEYGMHIEDGSDHWTFATLQTYMIEHEGWSGEAEQQEIFSKQEATKKDLARLPKQFH
jgi:hypothetical protein